MEIDVEVMIKNIHKEGSFNSDCSNCLEYIEVSGIYEGEDYVIKINVPFNQALLYIDGVMVSIRCISDYALNLMKSKQTTKQKSDHGKRLKRAEKLMIKPNP